MTDHKAGSSTTVTLGEATCAIGKSLLLGHLPSLADAIMDQEDLHDILLQRLIDKINLECVQLCQLSRPLSPFRKWETEKFSSFKWKSFVDELAKYAPLLLQVLSAIVTHKKKNVTTVHYPKLCTAVAVLLKERNREMCGLQSIISLLLYSSHVDKQVSAHLINVGNVLVTHFIQTKGLFTFKSCWSVHELHGNT